MRLPVVILALLSAVEDAAASTTPGQGLRIVHLLAVAAGRPEFEGLLDGLAHEGGQALYIGHHVLGHLFHHLHEALPVAVPGVVPEVRMGVVVSACV